MKTCTAQLTLLITAFLFAGCKAGIPNAVFNCVEDVDCPPNFFCHTDKGLCFDTVCVPARACSDPEIDCGQLDDGCGNILDCDTELGGCTLPEVCGGDGNPFSCDCPQETCEGQGAMCGLASNGCGLFMNCGQCGGSTVCEDGSCVCTLDSMSEACAGKECGNVSDGCGGEYSCGTCDDLETCGGDGTPNECGTGMCTPATECSEGAECGTQSDGCDDRIDCGDCPGGNQWKCKFKSNQCQCTPFTCAGQGWECGNPGDGCGGTLDCEAQRGCDPGQSCNTEFECEGCTCEDEDVECGLAEICGSEQFCGDCGDRELCVKNTCESSSNRREAPFG